MKKHTDETAESITSEINDAQHWLAMALIEIDKRIKANQSSTDTFIDMRNLYLTETTQRLLPSISKLVLTILKAEVPDFVTLEVEANFTIRKRGLFWLSRKKRQRCLDLLQVRLKAYLGVQQYQQVAWMNDSIMTLGGELSTLLRNRVALLAFTATLHSANRQSIVPPIAVMQQLRHINSVTRTLRSQQADSREPDDLSALLFYLATNMQSSMQTVSLGDWLSIIYDEAEANEQAERQRNEDSANSPSASNEFPRDESANQDHAGHAGHNDTSDCHTVDFVSSGIESMAIGVGVAGAVGIAAIVTDCVDSSIADGLGLFS